MHKLLERQLRRCFGPNATVPAEWRGLLALVSRAYEQADDDRALLEHSLELTSEELLARNRQLEEDIAERTRAAIALRASERRYRRLSRQLKRAHARINADYARLTEDLHLARQVQRHLIPTGTHAHAGLRFHSSYHPASAVGGDYFDCIPAADGGTMLLIGDVTGKGAAAAMLVAAVKSALLGLAAHESDPAALLLPLNALVRSLSEQAMTLYALSFPPGSGAARLANAGHLFPFLLPAGGPPRLVDVDGGLPLGLLINAKYATNLLPLAPGDRLVLYTDGIVEATNAQGELFGFPRFAALLTAGGHLAAPALAATVLDAVAAHAGAHPTQDDITLVIVDVGPGA